MKIKSASLSVVIVIAVLYSIMGQAQSGANLYRGGDYEKAAEAFRHRSSSGDKIAQNNLGAMYLKGRGVPQDYSQARTLFAESASKGLAGAMFNLGIMHLRGYGQARNPTKAFEWFEKSAKKGDKEAQFR